MRERDVGRVVVGVEDTLAGLRALREAVELARGHGMEVRAVRSYQTPQEPGGLWWYPPLGPHSFPADDDLREMLRRDATTAVVRAFELAMGGVPRDVVVRVEPDDVPLCRALPAVAHREDDILVVAASRRSRWWCRQGGSLPRRCLRCAVCPVLVVPVPQAARELGGGWRPRRRLRRRRELADLLGGRAPTERRRTEPGTGPEPG
ncbi:hypothetical protein DN069_01945 [Streptacidiphilus pinicola]|uniref:UspA domain-containing protein n=1 Tax=Streptacidiphilus pinicola TaxID=2219663 RepID=A0A2X0IV69_9ACTN|nr:universal stress protein [Streptacidiphilus pinicola]RAG87311.1 hypothetical protein DN069_01945 [Streptacidiphilus pinicola]